MKLTIEPLDIVADARLLHRWVTHPRAKFWMMQDATLDDVRREYGEIAANPHHDAFLGRVDGRPAFLVETYDPLYSALADLPELRPGDLGMHVLIGPPDGEALPGYTTQVFAAVIDHCFADPAVRRIVVEPDATTQRSGRRTSTPASSSCARWRCPARPRCSRSARVRTTSGRRERPSRT